MNHALKEFDITSAEYTFLLSLYRKEGITQDELSAYLYIDKSATARAISSLEKKGYVIKDKDLIDKRCNRISLTDKAKEYKDRIMQRVWSWSEFLTDELDEETKSLVMSVLESMTEKVERTNLKKELEKL